MKIRDRLREFKAGMAPTIRESRVMLLRIKKSPLSILGVSILIFFGLLAVLAPVLAPPPFKGQDPWRIPKDGWMPTPRPPGTAVTEPVMVKAGYTTHIFGTAQDQTDIFYGCIWGASLAFREGFQVVGVALIIGLVTGCLAGYYGGIIDELLMRFTDIIFAFPALILAMALVTALGKTLDNVMLALILVWWPSYTRVIRGEILRVKQEDYVEAAKAVGCSDLRVIVRHILPNAIYPVLIVASLDIGAVVLSVAALSFLGISGVPAGYADWGQMISYAQAWIAGGATLTKYWYVFTIPGIFIFTFVLGWNLLGDAFRDILDPTIRRR